MKQFSKDLGNVCLAPKGKWSREQEYERLALVYNDYNNLSYVAKINVPSGVDIENREYWQPMNATGYADNNFINLTSENENGTITAYESLEEAIATILPINRRAGATLSFYNLNSDRLDRQAEFELWQFNSTDLANWENKDYWNNIYYNWNVFEGWYISDDALKNHVKIPNVGQYAYVGSNLNDAILYQCRTNGTWTNTGIKVRNYISVVVSGNITIGDNGNWFSDGKDTGIPSTPSVDEQLDNISLQLQQHTTEINNLKVSDTKLQDQITSNDSDITSLTAKHESLSKTVQGIAATGGASTATNVTYNNDSSGLNAENAQDAIDEVSSMVIYDVSARNNGAVFESIQALLSNSNLSTLIPISVRHGGMTIRFVQSSDNKYVQYRLMTDEWSIDINDWSFCGNNVYDDNPEFVRVVIDNKGKILEAIGVDGTKLFPSGVEVNNKINFDGNETTIIENPEFIEIKLDSAGHILWGIQKNGNIYFGAGVPQQVINYIEEKIADLSLDEYEGIVAFLSDYLESDTTLKVMIDSINKRTPEIIGSPEFLEVTTDSEDKVLEGIQKDGTKVIGGGFNVGGPVKILGEMEVSGVSYKVIENPEYLAAWVDAKNKVIFGLKTDGKTYIGDADFINYIEDIKAFLGNFKDKNIDLDALTSITTTKNPEYISVVTDLENKILAGRTPDGAAFENVGFSTPKVSIDGAAIKNIEDTEGRIEIFTDAEGKIISYRDVDGVKHEEVGIKLSEKGLSDLEKDLKTVGIGVINWSDEKELHIAEPKCAVVNFIGILAMPTTKTDDYKAYMQFWDMNGNYFKKEVIMNAQGSSSLAHPKKNIAVDICNNNGWNDDDTFKLQVGSWVPQDSFHLKGFYMDAFRGLCPVAYKLYDQIVKTRGELNDYVWKRAFINFDLITSTSNGSSTANDTKAQYNDGARCFPDGFPCIVYLNGEFYGIYSWQLKKHRDNYHMKKNNAKHVHLDGILNDVTIWGDTVNWNAFEIRNPKGLKTVDGGKYNGDNPTEITGDSNVDATTAEVKGYIENFHTIKETIVNAYAVYNASNKTKEDKNTFKQIFETYLDSMNLIDYIIFSDVSNNYDGFNKNWQWFTYDGVKWYCGVYDTDGVFGGYFDLNDTIVPPLTNHLTIERQSVAAIGATWMITPIYSVYKDELESRYAELRNLKVIDTNNIVNLMVNWLDRLGNKATFEKEWEKWSDFIKNDSIHRMYKWVVESINNMDSVYNYNQN